MNRKISHALSTVVVLAAVGSAAAVGAANAAGYPTSPAICTGKYFHVQAEPGWQGTGYDLIGGGTTWYIGYSAPQSAHYTWRNLDTGATGQSTVAGSTAGGTSWYSVPVGKGRIQVVADVGTKYGPGNAFVDTDRCTGQFTAR